MATNQRLSKALHGAQLLGLSALLGRNEADGLLDEFDELYTEKRSRLGYWRALAWFWLQVIRGIPHLFLYSRLEHNVIGGDVFKHNRKLLFAGLGGAALLLVAVAGINARSHLLILRHRVPSQTVLIRPSAAVLGFSSRRELSGAADIAEALTEMLRTEISAGEKIRSITGEDTARMEKDLSISLSGSLSQTSLARIRQYSGASFVITGFVPFREVGTLRFDITVQDTATGDVVASIPEAGPETTLLSMVSNAGRLVRDKILPGSTGSVDTTSMLKMTMPASDEATQLYLAGISRLRDFDASAATDLLTRAASLDPHSARIQSALADGWSRLGYEQRAREAVRQALKSGDLLPPEQRTALQGRYFVMSSDWAEAVKIYTSLWTIYRDNLEYGISLAKAKASARDIDGAFQTIAEMHGLPIPLGSDPRIDLVEAQVAETKGDFKHEQEAAVAAMYRARERGILSLLADAQLRSCWALNALGDRHKALEYAEQAKWVYVAIGDRGGEARAIKNIGDVKDDIADHQGAKAAYLSAENIFREIGNQTGVAVTLNDVGYTLKDLGDLQGAEESFKQSLAISRDIGNDNFQAKALNGLAGVFWRKGDLFSAAETYEQALNGFSSLGNEIDAATVTENIAILFQQQGDLDKAEQRFEAALQMTRKLGDKEGEARTLGNLGDLLLLRGNLRRAKEQFESQLSIGDATDRKQSAYALVGLGEVMFAEGDLDGATHNYERAIALRLKNGESGLAAEARVVLAEALLEQDPARAESVAREAMKQFQQEHETDDEASSTAVLALAVFEQGRKHEGQELIDTAFARIADSKDQPTKLDVSIKYAHIHGLDSRGSIRMLKSLIEDAHGRGFKGYELEARLALGQLEVASGDSATLVHLKALQNDARANGFGLIQRKVGQMLTTESK